MSVPPFTLSLADPFHRPGTAMPEQRKPRRILTTRTPAEEWAHEQRVRAARMAMFDRMLKDALDG